MPYRNLTKIYPNLLEIMVMSELYREISLKMIYDRDILNNENFKFRGKQIYPTKMDHKIDINRNFMHIITETTKCFDERRNTYYVKREFEKDRSERLHWIKEHIKESIGNLIIFSSLERDKQKRKDVTRTYVYNKEKKYIVVLEPQRTNSYYLLTAYYINKEYGEKEIAKKLKNKLDTIE